MIPGHVARRAPNPLRDGTIPSVDDTIEFIKCAHADQVDKAGNPYWRHPVAVMYRLGADATKSEKLAALLHDVIEDTTYRAEDLRRLGYSADVIAAVELLSRPKGADRPSYQLWIRAIAASGNRIAIKVKIADNEDNSDPARLAALPVEGRGIVRRYQKSLAVLRQAI